MNDEEGRPGVRTAADLPSADTHWHPDTLVLERAVGTRGTVPVGFDVALLAQWVAVIDAATAAPGLDDPEPKTVFDYVRVDGCAYVRGAFDPGEEVFVVVPRYR